MTLRERYSEAGFWGRVVILCVLVVLLAGAVLATAKAVLAADAEPQSVLCISVVYDGETAPAQRCIVADSARLMAVAQAFDPAAGAVVGSSAAPPVPAVAPAAVDGARPPSPSSIVAAALGHKLLSSILALLLVGVTLELAERVSERVRFKIGSETRVIDTDPVAAGIYHGLRWLGVFLFVGLVLS